MARLPILDDIFERAGLIPHEAIHWRWTVETTDEPRYGNPAIPAKSRSRPCGVCGSPKTRCIFFDKVICKEPTETYEYECESCGNYTTYFWEGW